MGIMRWYYGFVIYRHRHFAWTLSFNRRKA